MNLVLNALLVPSYGMIGAAVATTLSFTGLFLLKLEFTRRAGQRDETDNG